MASFLVFVVSIIPQNLVSFVLGCLTRVRFPKFIRPQIHKSFIQLFKINMNEAEYPQNSYETIEDIFTRRIKRGITYPGGLCSPCDGTFVMASRNVSGDFAIQAKGLHYSLTELIADNTAEPKAFCTIYLAPHNYHRVHSPIDGTVESLIHIPGELWPVNETFIPRIPRIFTRNERLIFKMRTPKGHTLWVVMVGALNVGRIAPAECFQLSHFVTNSDPVQKSKPNTFVLTPPCQVRQGDELGTFMLGSTVILVFDQQATDEFDFAESSRLICLGDKLSSMGDRIPSS